MSNVLRLKQQRQIVHTVRSLTRELLPLPPQIEFHECLSVEALEPYATARAKRGSRG